MSLSAPAPVSGAANVAPVSGAGRVAGAAPISGGAFSTGAASVPGAPVSGAASWASGVSAASGTASVSGAGSPVSGAGAPVSSPADSVSGAPTYYPTPAPRQSPEADAPEPNSSGALYRPGPVTPAPPGPVSHQANPQAGLHQPAVPSSPGPLGAADPNPHQTSHSGPNQGGQPGPNPGAQLGPNHGAQPGPNPGAQLGANQSTQPGLHQGTPPGPLQVAPQAGPQQLGSQPMPSGPHQAPPPGPQPARPIPPQPGAHWTANGQPPPPVPGPYPPAVVPPNQANQPPGPNPPPPVDPYQQLPWVSDGTPTAEEFARRRLAKPAEPVATMGARAMLQKGTMGLVRLAPGKREQEYKQDVEMVRRNFGGLRQVTVVNPKGGAGKTVAVLLLAMTFGQKRGGYVLAWDNNETQGTLGMRAQQDFHARTVRDMMRDLHLFRGAHGRVGDLSQYVRAQGEGMFDVLASDESATAGEMLTASAFAEIREIVSRFYKLIFVDTGNNVRAQNWQAAMDATDQLVITMSARNDSAETAARMLDHLEQSGRQRLVRQAVSVVTMPPTRKDIDLPAIQRHFAARTRAVLLAPYEKLIDSGEPLRYGHLSNGTRDSWLKIAAAVAEGL
ncbi:chromosome partitioning protein [Actinoplanes sp. NPDC049548]|uniref:MinD/ParA family ATP-binding protein n=1 Tax=Actinoplanes sp. NPDC049548 TaxID=3155152 RepID=UPI00344879A3